VGTYFEKKFIAHLQTLYAFRRGNAASGIDFPDIGVDIKVTSVKQPQSSCPYKAARQKVYGLGYSLLVFVYEKRDDRQKRAGRLAIQHVIFVEKGRTGDYQTSTGLLKILRNNGNEDDVAAFLLERHLPVEEIEAAKLAAEIVAMPPREGYLTISNALQWRLQYGRVIEQADSVSGIKRVL
jgi:hypothetical protein